MPFRQLPRTDAERLQALEAAAAKVATIPGGPWAISAATKTRLDTTLPQFRTEVTERGTALAGQTAATLAQDTQGRRTRMWTSHFYQNLNMGIDRGVFPASARAFYQLDVSQESLPSMSSEADLVLWAGRAVSGEAARIAAGGSAIPFPPIAEVSAELTLYQTLRAQQSTKKDAYDDEAEDVEALRPEADALILDIWDEVEFTYRHESASSLRANAREYGVVYVSRPGEPPPAPTGVTLTPGAGNTLTAGWNAVENADSYRVLRQQVGTDPDFIVAGNPTAPTLSLGTFPAGATVRVKVRALRGVTEGPDSAVVETTIPDTP